MHPIVNHLIQLQELTLIREEQRAAARTEHLEQLNASIKAMSSQLPDAVRQTFEKLQKRDLVAIAPVTDSRCSVCGMTVPISLVQSIRGAKEFHSCPNCARVLYTPEDAPRRLGQRTRITAPRKIGISRFSSQSLMVPRLAATQRDDAIAELALKMETEGFINRADRLVEEALRREAIVSTAVEDGLAFPHVRCVEGGGLTLALGVSPKGIRFADKAKVHMIFFMVIPTAASAFHLKLLAGLARTFEKEESRKTILAEAEPEKLWKALCKVTRATVK